MQLLERVCALRSAATLATDVLQQRQQRRRFLA
jgi:hypothetical protein